jgi:hypothetical protein
MNRRDRFGPWRISRGGHRTSMGSANTGYDRFSRRVQNVEFGGRISERFMRTWADGGVTSCSHHLLRCTYLRDINEAVASNGTKTIDLHIAYVSAKALRYKSKHPLPDHPHFRTTLSVTVSGSILQLADDDSTSLSWPVRRRRRRWKSIE